jgi:hypothetical protein
MVPCINSDTEEAPAPHPKRVAVPSAKVISADNAADQELLSHRKAHIASRTAATLDTDLDGADNYDIQLVSPHTKKRLIKGKFSFTLCALLTATQFLQDGNRLHKVLMPRTPSLRSLLLSTKTKTKTKTPWHQ